jgi:glucosamine--fructose-6-phosphate aminotransferase (isomerizing)
MMTQMAREALSAPTVLARQYQENQSVWEAIAYRLKQSPPPFVMTIARGSSDHATMYAKYLFEIQCGWVTASAAPSIYTIYERRPCVKNALVLAISQSGQSPDLVEVVRACREQGAVTVAIVNEVASPLARAAEYVVPLWAGPEMSVAATKSYVSSLFALLHFVAIYQSDQTLMTALAQLPARLARAERCHWDQFITAYQAVSDALIIARGYSFPVALEVALKFKETCVLHAEAFSSAEVLHGPFALIKPDYPVLILGQKDAALHSTEQVCARIRDLGGRVLFACPGVVASSSELTAEYLPLPKALHPLVDPLLVVQTFYLHVAQLALARGLNPDQPNNLQKVTQTL